MNKMTKRNMYEAMVNFGKMNGEMAFKNEGETVIVSPADIVAFATHEIELLDKKNVKAKEYADKKKTEADALADTVLAVLTDEYQQVGAIMEALGDETLTAGKITAKIGKLIEAGLAEKSEMKIKVETDGKTKTMTRMGYRRVVAE